MLKLLRITSTALALGFLCTSASFAAQELVVKTDQTQLISISGNPGTVVIGNPSIADVTVHGNKIFVHGRAFGSTNLIILDENGNQLSNLDVTVQLGGENNVTNLQGWSALFICMCAELPGNPAIGRRDWLLRRYFKNGREEIRSGNGQVKRRFASGARSRVA